MEEGVNIKGSPLTRPSLICSWNQRGRNELPCPPHPAPDSLSRHTICPRGDPDLMARFIFNISLLRSGNLFTLLAFSGMFFLHFYNKPLLTSWSLLEDAIVVTSFPFYHTCPACVTSFFLPSCLPASFPLSLPSCLPFSNVN